MKFRCERDSLAEAFGIASRATSTRSNSGSPALSGLHLRLAGDLLTVTGTDRELTIQLDVPVGGEVDGVVLVPARLATDIVRSLGVGAVEITVTDDDMVIEGGRSKFSLRPFAANDFPPQPEPPANSFTLPVESFGDALRQVVRAASADEQRQALTGVLLSAESGGLRLVATDSYRLAVRDLPGTSAFGPEQKVLVPSKALSELLRLLPPDGDLTLRLGERDAVFEVESVRITTRLIEHEFPNYRQLIPSNYPNVLTVQRDDLLEAIRRVKILASNSNVRLTLGGDRIVLETRADNGTASEAIDGRHVGSDMSIAFNADYLASGVEAVTSDEITLETLDPGKPAVLRGVGQADFLYLLMPVRMP